MEKQSVETGNKALKMLLWGGWAFGALSLFGFFESILNFGMVAVVSDMLAFYRDISRSLFGWIWRLLPFNPTQTYQDILGVNLVLCGISWRQTQEESIKSAADLVRECGRYLIFFVLMGMTLFIWLVALASLLAAFQIFVGGWLMIQFSGEDTEEFQTAISYFSALARILFVLFVLLALNAFGVSIG